jgi:hypothetical protein
MRTLLTAQKSHTLRTTMYTYARRFDTLYLMTGLR